MADGTKSDALLPKNVAGWLDLFVKTGAVFAAVFAIHQYLQARHDLRVTRTLDHVTRFNNLDTPIGEARGRITQALWANESQILRLRAILLTLPEDQFRALQERFVRKLLDGSPGGGVRTDLHAVIQFFDELVLCIAAGLCDPKTAYAFFGGYAETLWGNFRIAIEASRTLDPNYGAGLEHVMRDARQMPALEPPQPTEGD